MGDADEFGRRGAGSPLLDLALHLQAIAAGARSRRDPQTTAKLEAAMAALQRSGVLEAALQAGELAPDFELQNTEGRWLSLSDLLRDGAAVITFYRGAWCPYCDLTLRALQETLSDIRRLGGQVAAICPQPQAMAQAHGERQRLSFELLQDAGNRVSRLFGLTYDLPPAWITHYRSIGIDIGLLNGTGRWELPLAATYVIDRNGTAAYASVELDPARRFDPRSVLHTLTRLQA